MRRRPTSLELIAFVVGASALGSEIAAARLMAPYFGASTIIWANTIATVLVALSVGYAIGGRLADRDGSRRGLGRIVLAAAGLLAVVPFVSGPFLRTSVEALDAVSAGAFAGSLLAVCLLIAAPVLLLGAVSPYVLRLSVRSVESSGRTSGRLSAISTLGSLCGTFLSALVLVPFLGAKRTFLVFAVALALVALVALRSRRAALVPAALALLLLAPTGTVKATGDREVVWEGETEYQYARVLESEDGTRLLELNEGQAIHSLMRPGTVLTGDYWDEYLVMPQVALGRAPRSVAILGNAGGTVARAYGTYFPDTAVDTVELDGELNAVAREWFDLAPRPGLRMFAQDARPWLRAADRRYDAIFVDAYRQPYIPFYLATREFFALVREKLNPGGVVLVNVGFPEGSQDLEQVLTATMRAVFPTVLRDPSEPTNTVVLGTAGGAGAGRLRAAAGSLPAELRPLAAATAARLEPGLRGGRVYTDDVAPVEWLIDASIVEVAASGER
jgi:spermidine synthase/multisubunit Na+/H+ antiporter MnhF subunit